MWGEVVAMVYGSYLIATFSLVANPSPEASGAPAVADGAGSATPVAAEQEASKAVVRVRVTAESHEIEFDSQKLPWGSNAEFVAETGGDEHRVQLRVDRAGHGELAVRLGYSVNGKTLVAKERVQGKTSSTITAKSDDGKIAVQIVVRQEAGKIEIPDVEDDDPLAGL